MWMAFRPNYRMDGGNAAAESLCARMPEGCKTNAEGVLPELLRVQRKPDRAVAAESLCVRMPEGCKTNAEGVLPNYRMDGESAAGLRQRRASACGRRKDAKRMRKAFLPNCCVYRESTEGLRQGRAFACGCPEGYKTNVEGVPSELLRIQRERDSGEPLRADAGRMQNERGGVLPNYRMDGRKCGGEACAVNQKPLAAFSARGVKLGLYGRVTSARVCTL